MHLRRTPNKRKIVAELQTKHIRRRIDETKTSIKIERIAAEIGFEPLRQDYLESITRTDVILGSFYGMPEFVRMKIAVDRLRFEFRGWRQWKLDGFCQFVRDGVDRFNGSRIDFFDWSIVEECVRDDPQAAPPMIETRKAADDKK